jgi:dihydroorotate dehydrogenase electron transfer subunit
MIPVSWAFGTLLEESAMSLNPSLRPVPPSVELDRFPVAENICSVVSNEAVNDRYRHMVLAAPELALTARAGQFFHLLCPRTEGEQPFLRRPMSVYRVDPARERIEFLYKPVGAGTAAMATLRTGDGFNVLGPLGKGFNLDPAWRHIVVLGRGVGLATLAPLAELAASMNVGVTAILSVERAEYLMSVSLFEAAGAEIITVTDEDRSSSVENVGNILERLVETGKADAFFTCGSDRLMQLMKRLGGVHGVPGQVALEQQMACGLGMCFCCVRSFEVGGEVIHRRVCCEGPVFDIQEALSW